MAEPTDEGRPGAAARPRPGRATEEGGPAAAAARLVRTVEEARAVRAVARDRGERLVLVPTMGFLHEGHLRLLDRARALGDLVVVSAFVNPTQFGPQEDFESYPRDLDRDLALASARGADVLFAPEEAQMYPVPQTIWVDPGTLARRLCGRQRPGHFRGVLTVVMKLFAILAPDVAVFGRKDFQQSVLVRRMVEELRLPVRIEVVPTVRAEDGLALSSRNSYLEEPERQAAAALPEALRRVRRAFAAGEEDAATLTRTAEETLAEAGVAVEYVSIVDPEELTELARATPDAVCALAARVGGTRLIDNGPLGGPSELDEVG